MTISVRGPSCVTENSNPKERTNVAMTPVDHTAALTEHDVSVFPTPAHANRADTLRRVSA